MAVHVHWEYAERPLDDRAVQAAVSAALGHGGRAGLAVSVVLVGDAVLAELHDRWLGDDAPTDVISFDLGGGGGGPDGELYVSVERALDVAARRGLDPGRELALYLVHGALHLCGFDDAEEGPRAEMRRAEETVLRGLGYSAASTGEFAAFEE